MQFYCARLLTLFTVLDYIYTTYNNNTATLCGVTCNLTGHTTVLLAVINDAAQFAFVIWRPYCLGRPKKLCFTMQSLAVKTVGVRLSVVKQSFFGLPGQYGCHVTKANSCPKIYVVHEHVLYISLSMHVGMCHTVSRLLFQSTHLNFGHDAELHPQNTVFLRTWN